MKLTQYRREAIHRAICADIPKPDKKKRREAIQAAVVKAMSPECRKVFNKSPSALRQKYLGDVVYTGDWGDSRDIVIGDCPDEKLEEIVKVYKDEDESISKTKLDLLAALRGCTTHKQLRERMPEFEKYLPKESAAPTSFPIAINNLVADLTKLGWPKKETK